MDYESRVYIVNEWNDIDDGIRYVDEETGKPLGEIIAQFDLSYVEDGFLDVFKDEAKCCLYASNNEESESKIVKDYYGNPLTSAGILAVYCNIKDGENWRTTALKDFLNSLIYNQKSISRDFTESFKVYHYGY